jgi:23S rRNA (uracil1939-C5)-methyltransferase
MIPPRARIFEYYAGVGSIGLGLVARGHEVFFNELGPGSLHGLRRGLDEIVAAERLVTVGEGRAGSFAESYTSEGVVIVDPPRKGLDPELLARLLAEPPRRLIYLSCGIDALLRESEALERSGNYHCTSLSGFSYFPFTDHVETLLVLSRRD